MTFEKYWGPRVLGNEGVPVERPADDDFYDDEPTSPSVIPNTREDGLEPTGITYYGKSVMRNAPGGSGKNKA